MNPDWRGIHRQYHQRCRPLRRAHNASRHAVWVDLGLSKDGIYLQINEIEIRPEREALEQGLIEAFKDELDL